MFFLTRFPHDNSQRHSERDSPSRFARLFSGHISAFGRLCLYAVLLSAAPLVASAQTPRPVLLSEPTSTRAIALESVTREREPFASTSPIPWSADRRTRITLFAMNLALAPGEDSTVLTAGAEDGAGLRYELKVEYTGAVAGAPSISEVVVRLSDDLGDVGDVLVWVTYHGQSSNRVRVGLGHIGGGPPDDAGAGPTQPLLLGGSVILNNAGLEGVEMTLTGGTRPETLKTAADGSYFFIVAPLGSYTLTPRADFYDFDPASRSFDAITTSQTGLFFGAHRQTHTIFGQLRDDAGRELFNVTITLTSGTGFEPRTMTTDDSGQFSFFDVPAGQGYTVTPLDNDVATFKPESIGPLTQDVMLNLTGTRRTYSISGLVTDVLGPVKGVRISIPTIGRATTTDANGRYLISGLAAGLGYTTVASDDEHTFDVDSQTINILQSDTVIDFVATPHFILSGRVDDAGGRGIFGITITLGGKQSGETYTDINGNYAIAVTEYGDYTLTASKEQSYYAFTPQSKSVNGVHGARTGTDFKASLSSTSNPSYVVEFDGGPKTIDYSVNNQYFWPWDVDLGHFFWELWAMPGQDAAATYMIADGYGGGHAILFGFGSFGSSEPGRYQLLGNVWNPEHSLTYFSSDEGPAPGEWGHYAAGWDGKYIVAYFNGVPVGRTQWDGPRRSPGPSGGAGRLYVGGSNHSNFMGRIAQIRGYEDSNPREAGGAGSIYSSFRPQTVFSVEGSLMSWYFRPGDLMADLSAQGKDGRPHVGLVRGWAQAQLYPCDNCPLPVFVIDPTAPNFADPEHPGHPPAPVESPAATPTGALVFDSFSRANSTYALGGAGGLGSTEGGSAGALVWHTTGASGTPQPFGILNGRGVLLADRTAVTWVDAGAVNNNLDIRVERHARYWGTGHDTGLSFRVVDADNYFFAYTSESEDPSVETLAVGYVAGGQRTDLTTGVKMPITWTTLRVVTTAGGLVEVYADGSKIYTTQNPFMSSAIGAGLYNNGPGLALTNRWDNFTVFNLP